MHHSLGSAAFLLALPALLAGQSVRGVVSDRNTSAPLPGVVLLLLDGAGATVGRALSNEVGEYRVTALRPGAHRLRALRIGFLPVTTDVFVLGANAEVNRPLALAGIPVALDTFRVTSRGRCDVRPDSAMATYRVWEQVRTALTAAEITGRARTVRARLITFDRTLDRRGEEVLHQTSRVKEGYTDRPWTALSQDSLRRSGYVHNNRDGSTSYFAPDIPVLLSDDFLEDHCVRISRDSDASMLAVEFEPVRARREIPEIQGTVWLDRKSAELRRMRFRYVNVTGPQSASDAGGEMRFARLKNGAWMISGWNIRMPVIESRLVTRGLDGHSEIQRSVREFHVEGGALAMVTRGKDTLWARPPVVLRGHVLDSATGTAWGDAHVAVRGTSLTTRTDSAGHFTIAELIPGEYVLEIASPELEAVGVSRQITAMVADSGATLTARLPPAGLIARSACANTEGGMIVGLVRTRAAENLGGIRVIAEWRDSTDAPRSVETLTNDVGRYVLCGVPYRTIDVRIESDNGGANPVQLSIARWMRMTRADFTLSATAGASARPATLTGRVTSAANRQPIIDVVIRIASTDHAAVTNAQGTFRVTGIPPGRHTVIIRRTGYVTRIATLDFGAGRIVDYTIILNPTR